MVYPGFNYVQCRINELYEFPNIQLRKSKVVIYNETSIILK